MTPPWRFGHCKTVDSVHGDVKRKDWNARKKDVIGHLGLSTEREEQCRPDQWSSTTKNTDCIPLIKQSIDTSSRNTVTCRKTCPTRITAMSGILRWIIQDFWLKKPQFWPVWVYVEGKVVKTTGRRSLEIVSHFDMRRVSAISDLSLRYIFYGLMAFDIHTDFLFHFKVITYLPTILICFQNWEKARRPGIIDLEGSWWCCKRHAFRQGRVKLGRGRGPSLSVPQSLATRKPRPLSLFSSEIPRSPGAMAPWPHPSTRPCVQVLFKSWIFPSSLTWLKPSEQGLNLRSWIPWSDGISYCKKDLSISFWQGLSIIVLNGS